MSKYKITVSKDGEKFKLVAESDRAIDKPRFFKDAKSAIDEANSLADFYDNAVVILEA